MIFIVTTGLILLVLVSFLCYYSRILFVAKLITLPVFFIFSGLVTYHYLDNLGKPIERPLPETFGYQHHRYVGEETIYVWLTTEEKGDLLYAIPYSRETAKALEEAKEERDEGGNPQMTQQVSTGEGRPPRWLVTNPDVDSLGIQETK